MADEQKVGTLVWDMAAGHQLFQAGLQQAGAALGQFAGIVKSTNFLMIAGFAAVGIAAFKAAQKAVAAIVPIDSALREVATLLPETVEQLGYMRRELIDLSTRVPQAPELLTEATYQAISAGFTDVAEALEIVGVSAQAAVAGLTDTFTAVDAITTALNAYQLSSSEAGRVSDIFFKTVEQGKVKFEELAQNFGTVATSAALAGVTMEEANAAIATLTKFGINAAEATTSLNRAILSIISPTKKQEEAAAKYGVQLGAAAIEAKGFTGVLRELEEATQGNVEALAEIFPNIRAARSVFVLAGNGADEYRRILREVTNSAGATGDAFRDMNGSLENQRKLLANNINALWAKLGTLILPGVLNLVKDLNRLFESQTEELQRLAEAQGDYARAQELAREATLERLNDELNSLDRLFKQRELLARQAKDTRGTFLGWIGIRGTFRSGDKDLDDIINRQFDIRDGWESIRDELEIYIARGKDAITNLEEEGRLNEQLELALRQRIDSMQELLGFAEAYLAVERQVGDLTAGETPEQRKLNRARERLNRLRRFAPADSDVVKRARETVQELERQVEYESAIADQQKLHARLRAENLDLIGKSVKEIEEEIATLEAGTAVRNAVLGYSAEEQVYAQRRLDLAYEYLEAVQRQNDAMDTGKKTLEDMVEPAADLVKALESYILAGASKTSLDALASRFADIDVALEKIDVEKLTREDQIRRTIELLNELAAALEDLKDFELTLPEGIEQLSEADALDRTKLAAFRKEFEEIVKSSNAFGIKVLAIDGALRKWDLTIEQLPEGLRELVEAAVAVDEEILTSDEQMLKLIDDISFAINSALALADAFGLSSTAVNTIVRNVDLLARSLSRAIASGGLDFQSGFGIASSLIGLGASIFGGGGESPEERRRRETLERNTRALQRLTISVDAQIEAARGVRSDDFAFLASTIEALVDSFDAPLKGGRNFAWFRDFGGGSIEQFLLNLGIDPERLKALADVIPGLTLDFQVGSQAFIDQLKAMQEALRNLDLAVLRESYEGAREWATLVAEVFDEELTPQKEFDILRESLKKAIPDLDALNKLKNTPDEALDFWGQVAKKLTPDFYAKLFGPLSDPATVQAWEDFSRYMIENFDELFRAGFFGGLTTDEALALLSDIDANTDVLQELAKDAATDSGIQAISAINKVTTEQADIMIALDQTRNFYLMQIRDSTGQMLEAMNGGTLLTPPTKRDLTRFGTAGDVVIETVDVDINVSGADEPRRVATEVYNEFDRRLGTFYKYGIRGTGAAPRRNR